MTLTTKGAQGLPALAGQLALAAADAAAARVRLVDLVVGQGVEATVVALPEPGRVRIGLLGGLVEASSSLALQVGRSYAFTVAAVSPQIVLSPAASPLPTLAIAADGGMLGPGAGEVADWIGSLPRPLPDAPADARGQTLQAALLRLASGAPAAADLEAIARTLGHDQEARVLRLAQRTAQTAQREVETLRSTLKAQALVSLADAARDGGQRVQRSAARLVAGLNAIERDSAQRAERDAPIWLPLPAPEGSFLRDARMFLAVGDGESGGAASERPFTVVLLLDLTRLGPVRVDIALTGERMTATFQLARESMLHRLRGGLDALRTDLEAAGLRVGALHLRTAPDGQLPVADLLSPPPAAAGSGRIDVHA